jgi:hypothetical protein
MIKRRSDKYSSNSRSSDGGFSLVSAYLGGVESYENGIAEVTALVPHATESTV